MRDTEALRDVLSIEVGDDFKDGAMVGDYIVIAEVIDSEGDNYLMSRVSDGMTFWKQLGMLQARIDIIRELNKEELDI